MSRQSIVSAHTTTAIITGDNRLQDAIRFLADNVAPTSQRQYLYTYRQWIAFSESHDGNPLNFADAKVRAFLDHKPLAKRQSKRD